MGGVGQGALGAGAQGGGVLPTSGIPALTFEIRHRSGQYTLKKSGRGLKNRPRERHVAVVASPCAGGRWGAGSGGGGQHSRRGLGGWFAGYLGW